MGGPLQFQTKQTELYEYWYAPGEKVPVTDHPNLLEYWNDDESPKTPLSEYGVGKKFGRVGASLCVYLGIVWDLASDGELYGVPHYYRDQVAKALKRKSELVDYDYHISVFGEYDAFTKDVGFVLPRSCLTYGYTESGWLGLPAINQPSREQKRNRHKAGLFPIHSYQEFVSAYHCLSGDSHAELNLFVLNHERGQDLCRFLQRSWETEEPVLADFLETGELFIDLVVGYDEDYYDCIAVKSPSCIEGKIRCIEEKYQQAIRSYEERTLTIPTIEAMLLALEKLAAGRMQ